MPRYWIWPIYVEWVSHKWLEQSKRTVWIVCRDQLWDPKKFPILLGKWYKEDFEVITADLRILKGDSRLPSCVSAQWELLFLKHRHLQQWNSGGLLSFRYTRDLSWSLKHDHEWVGFPQHWKVLCLSPMENMPRLEGLCQWVESWRPRKCVSRTGWGTCLL